MIPSADQDSFVFEADDYADQETYEDALVLYAKAYRRGGKAPPPWNVWQKQTAKIAKSKAEAAEYHTQTTHPHQPARSCCCTNN